MKLVSTLLLASGLVVAMAADSASLRVGDGSRQLEYADYSSSSSSSSSGTSLSAGTWMWYLMLNAVSAPVDAMGGGCNGGCETPTCPHTNTSPDFCHPRCCVLHVSHPPPKKKSGGSSHKTTTSTKKIHWGDDGHDWANDGHSQWSDDGNYWYDDGAYWYDDQYDDHHYDDQWANDGYWYWDDDGHNGQAHWLSNNSGSSKQSSKNKVLFPLLFVGLVVGALAVALVARRNKRRREEEEYYASQQPGYVAPPPKEEKKKWYQKFRRNKKQDSPVQVAAQDEGLGGDFAQMQDEDDRSVGNGSLGGWSARSWGSRGGRAYA